ncbi:hypothetical protein SDRG_04255 [Saprolegnia diclina VS20]|uniref:NADP-dependent oxidoreductase domain-containing protein n=1 Tax=Saprolegnia diclina (strain VS20) TaxID=1156394 RepID=T0QX04_SAPDV|nr:hypothetical protein SDRG_04255 [Saprolegnia diclina VS20]EQC38550.1 hypothetical protein SDRG_04255 [Saprolegnia diclina VS20]|eukprot:XP_008608142.1 hypothetical protein SDRG_04255 [Saprolegnia diclina VS20]
MWSYTYNGRRSAFGDAQRIFFSAASNDSGKRALATALERGTRSIYIGAPDDAPQLAKVKKAIRDVVATTILRRDELSIVCECSHLWNPTALRTKVVDLLAKLDVAYLDGLLLPASLLPPFETQLCVDELEHGWRQLVEMRNEGLVKRIGVSDFPVVFLEVLFDRFPTDRVEIICLSVHPLQPQRHVIRFAHAKQLDVLARCPTALPDTVAYADRERWLQLAASIAVSHASLTFKYTLPSETVQADTAVAVLSPPVDASVPMLPLKTPSQVAVKWLLQRGLVCVPMVEGDEPYSDENVADLFSLTHPFVHDVASAAPSKPYQFILSKDEMVAIGHLGAPH